MRAPLTHRSQQKPTSATVQAGHGYAFVVKQGQKFRITDLHGGQIIDFLAWKLIPPSTPTQSTATAKALVDPRFHFSAANTRWHLAGATPAVGDALYSNTGEKMITVVDDTVKVHDMTFPCCYPELYEEEGIKCHRSCSGNIAEAMTEGGFWPAGRMDHREVPDPFNVFQNTPFYALKGSLLSSRKGDYLEMVAEMDVVCAVSSCPYDLNGFGMPTEVGVEVG
jgi:uncharacterized protein YcgI (DUF1989 family)